MTDLSTLKWKFKRSWGFFSRPSCTSLSSKYLGKLREESFFFHVHVVSILESFIWVEYLIPPSGASFVFYTCVVHFYFHDYSAAIFPLKIKKKEVYQLRFSATVPFLILESLKGGCKTWHGIFEVLTHENACNIPSLPTKSTHNPSKFSFRMSKREERNWFSFLWCLLLVMNMYWSNFFLSYFYA